MAMAGLERKKLETVQVVDGDDLGFAEEARELLGYKALADRLRQQDAGIGAANHMAKTLEEMQVYPYSIASVARYKHLTVMPAPEYYRVAVPALMLLAGVLAIVAGTTETYWLFGLPALCFIGCIAIADQADRRSQVEKSWIRLPLEAYDKPIPEFALQTAMDLKRAIPSVRFVIDELQVNQVTADPFLVAIDSADNEYFLEVWNEPRYERA